MANFEMNYTRIIIIVFGVLLVAILLIVGAFITQDQPAPSDQELVTPTRAATSPNSGGTAPQIQYLESSTRKMQEEAKNPIPLSTADTEVRKRITDRLVGRRGQASGYVYTTSRVRIEYLKSANIFHGEILTTDIQAAKQQANAWFITQGMSQEGICHLPFIFYLNPLVSKQLQTKDVVFDPLPPGC